MKQWNTQMPETTIRQLDGDEFLDAFYPLTTYAFRPSPPLPDQEEWKEIVRQRKGLTTFVLFEDQTPVASVVSSQMTQAIRGTVFGMGGVWGVATRPEARRKGYSKRLFSHLISPIRDSGRPFSCLYPFRESFYQRFGYTTFPHPKKIKFKPAALLPLLDMELDGSVETSLYGDDYDSYREYTHNMQESVHGMALFDHGNPAKAKREDQWQAKAIVDGEQVGLMLYKLEGGSVTNYTLRVSRFYTQTSQARYLLLAWIARHIDQAGQVEMWLPPYEKPETWQADINIKAQPVARAPMGRIIDIEHIGGMKTGLVSRSESFTAQIDDPLCEWNQGIWSFESRDGWLMVRPASSADCRLAINGLSALVYGTHDPADFQFRDWGNPSSELQAVMRELFPPKIPYIHELF